MVAGVRAKIMVAYLTLACLQTFPISSVCAQSPDPVAGQASSPQISDGPKPTDSQRASQTKSENPSEVLTGRLQKTETATGASSSAKVRVESAIAMYKQGNFKDALHNFEQLRSSPVFGDQARYYYACTLQRLGQNKAAAAEYMFIAKTSSNKDLRYRAWVALGRGKSAAARSPVQTAKGPGADAWLTPQEGYGKSGPPASSTLEVQIIPTSCGRRH